MALAATIAVLGIPLTSADAASAVSPIALSADGVTYASSLPGSLFSNVGRLVPSDQQAVRFWLRNDSTSTAYLRMALVDARFDDHNYASALSMFVQVDGIRGVRTSFSDATRCGSLVEPTLMQPGQTVVIDSVLLLADLPGTMAQAANASLTMNVSLGDAAPGREAQGSCGVGGIDIPVVSPPGSTSTSTAVPAASGSSFVISRDVFAASTVLWPVGGFAIGALLFFLIRRRRDDEDDNSHEKVTTHA